MKLIVTVLLVALVAVDAGVRNVEVSDSINSSSLQNLRDKRSLGVTRETKKEWDFKKKDDSSLHVTKQVSYNDGGALTMLPAVQDSVANNHIKVINQLQNGKGRPEIAQQMLSAASPGTTDFNIDTGIGSRHSRATIIDDRRFGYWKIVPRNNENNAYVTTKVLSPLPIQPITGIVQTVRRQSLLEKILQKSVGYHRQKQAQKQAYLDKLVAKRQPIQTVAVLRVPYVVTYAAAPAIQPSKHEVHKQLIAQKKKEKAKKFHEKLAAIYMQKAQKYGAASNPTDPLLPCIC